MEDYNFSTLNIKFQLFQQRLDFSLYQLERTALACESQCFFQKNHKTMIIRFRENGDAVKACITIEDVEMADVDIAGLPETIGLLEKLAQDAICKADIKEVIFVKP